MRAMLRLICLLALLSAVGAAQTSAPLTPREQSVFIEQLRARALERIDGLRNFLCTQLVIREVDKKGKDDGKHWKPLETLTIAIDYASGQTHARLLSVDGDERDPVNRQHGSMHIGAGTEFHSLTTIFAPDAETRFAFDHEETREGRRLCVARYEAPRATSKLFLRSHDEHVRQGHHGLIFADCATADVVRLRYSTDPTPLGRVFGSTDGAVVSSDWEIHFAPVSIDGRDNLVPVLSTVVQHLDRTLTRSQSRFVDYHKFESRTRILPPAEP